MQKGLRGGQMEATKGHWKEQVKDEEEIMREGLVEADGRPLLRGSTGLNATWEPVPWVGSRRQVIEISGRTDSVEPLGP